MRRFVIVGRTAHASADLRLDDIPSTGGRLDVLLRCIRAALLVSHGLRPDVVVYLVLAGRGGAAPHALRIAGAEAKFIRPDERSLAMTVQKALARFDGVGDAFCPVRPGVSVSRGGLDAVLADVSCARLYMLDAHGSDVRQSPIEGSDVAIVVGDHLGFDQATRERLAALGAQPVRLGPVSLHAEDAIAVVSNELDRRAGAASGRDPTQRA
jgi:tRNA (pseudouridine54-N1)-methyltransferase